MKRQKKLFVVIIALVLITPASLIAQTRNYYYESISQKFVVNKDTSVDVEETQTYNFTGEYHKGWRSLPFTKVSDIINVQVFDGSTSLTTSGMTPQPLQYVSSSLEKTNPDSWGKYTYRKNGGNLEIEWYYNAQDTTRTWILKYKLIGAVSFLSETKDELYWNLFTDYDVVVRHADATVVLPTNNFNASNFAARIYRSNLNGTGGPGTAEVVDNQTIRFNATVVFPKEDVTIAAGWPAGIVDRGAYWWQFLKVHFTFILSVFIVFLTLLSMVLYWYFTEVRGKGRGTIIPEYAPPQNLPPAMAELIVKEKITPKAWAATVIDLAVRGYVKITEEATSFPMRVLRAIGTTIPFIIFSFIIFGNYFSGAADYHPVQRFFAILILMFFGFFLLKSIFGKSQGKSWWPKDYIIEQVKEFAGDQNLHQYERDFLSALLRGGRFSTKAMRWNKEKGTELYKAMKVNEENLLKETETDTGAYDKPLSKDKYWIIALFVVFGAMIMFGSALGSLGGVGGWLAIALVVSCCALVFWLYVKFEARLSAEGAILREEWLGFKLYLETAERDRMQNLTPEIFEKYLPYAIIFGVEKKWGKAFEGISMQPPNWYHGAYVGGMAGSSGNTSGFSSGFSAGAFSASFASSFSSAFSSSGGGGASGGGGGAGGGGGGGGGGAS